LGGVLDFVLEMCGIPFGGRVAEANCFYMYEVLFQGILFLDLGALPPYYLLGAGGGKATGA
jgi:hypothetical protein